ncbi:MAG: histidine kinase, partial [Bacillota bacterium]|nr:histidine kinase [Bacillota bacterium]
MTKRIFYSIFLVALMVMLVVSGLIVGMMYDFSSAEKQNELRRETAYIAEGIKLDGIDYLKQVGALDDTRITWIASDGAVLYDSVAKTDEMENHADRKEVQEAFLNGSGEGERHSATLSEKTWYYALRLDDGSVVRLSVESVGILLVFLSAAYPLVFLLVILIILSLVLAFHTAKNITKPINEIDLEHPEHVVIYDELTPLLRKLTTQNREIQQQMKELKRRKEEFDTITSNMQEGLLVLDADGLNAISGHIDV